MKSLITDVMFYRSFNFYLFWNRSFIYNPLSEDYIPLFYHHELNSMLFDTVFQVFYPKSVIHIFPFVSGVNRLISSPISRIVSVPTTMTMNL